jgi:acyl CoA:acetate/3-ketoacid CoA transferase beta subunit
MDDYNDYSIDELICVCIARQVQDGEVLAQGMNTPLVMAGYILAQQTHAPHARFASAIGQSIGHRFSPLGITTIEGAWLNHGLIHPGFVTAALDLLPKFSPKEFFRPAQIDAAGFTNNIRLPRPRTRLPGTGGIPDVTVYSDRIYFYVPRHSPAVFVEHIDIRSGMGVSDTRRRGASPRYLVSDLGQFDWAGGRLRLTHLHPGISVEQVQRKTGFPLDLAPDVAQTLPPSAEELRLLREVIDPLGVRKLETLAGAARKDLLRAIIEQETSSQSY